MRRCVWLLVLLLSATCSAGPKPMSNKEIALMLRSGYSSESVLAEIQRRRLLEPLDDGTRAALRELRASSQLQDALESGKLRVTSEEASGLKKEASLAADREELHTQQTFRHAATIVDAQLARRVEAAVTPLLQIVRGFQDKLVLCRDGSFRRAEPNALDGKKLIALYFSAHWCAPCRKFSPGLVDFYNRVAPQHPEFELIFISRDRSRFNWETYMRDFAMPWPALDFDQIASADILKRISGNAIPSLVLLNAKGEIISQSYEGEKYLGPQKVVDDLGKIFAGQSLAQAP